jgi:hypothetical protein
MFSLYEGPYCPEEMCSQSKFIYLDIKATDVVLSYSAAHIVSMIIIIMIFVCDTGAKCFQVNS